jgi:hypothetical protein
VRCHHHSLDAVRLGGRLCARLAKPELGNDRGANVPETGFLQQPKHLSFQESTSDSAGPQLRIVHNGLRKLLAAHDVRDGDPAAGLQNPEHLLNHSPLPE